MARSRERGPLVMIGGGEDRSGDKAVLRHVVALAGGGDARVVVVATATAEPDELGEVYRAAFGDLGVAEVEVLPIATRDEANDDKTVAALERATAVFFTGGNQSRIAGIVGGSATDVTLHARWEQGLVVAGTSAGAAMMSSTMILGGGELLPTSDVRIGPGLGFVDGVVVDMHFAERGRLARLLAVVALYPHELGLGIDEDTAVVVRGARFEVVGAGAATVLDAGRVSGVRTPPEGATGAIALTGALLHVLPAGYGFDLLARTPVITTTPDETTSPGGTG